MNKIDEQIKLAESLLKNHFPHDLIPLILTYFWKKEYFHEGLGSQGAVFHLCSCESVATSFAIPLVVNVVSIVHPIEFRQRFYWVRVPPSEFEQNLRLVQETPWTEIEIQFCGVLYHQGTKGKDKVVWKIVDLCHDKMVCLVNIESGTTIRGLFCSRSQFGFRITPTCTVLAYDD
jgi:hypothetical protein